MNGRYLGDLPPDFPTLLRQSSPTTPIIMLFDNESETCVKLFTDFANRKQNQHVEIYLTDNSMVPERVVRKQIQQGMTEVLANSCHFHSECMWGNKDAMVTASSFKRNMWIWIVWMAHHVLSEVTKCSEMCTISVCWWQIITYGSTP